MNKISCYNGILYKIEYKPELSQYDFILETYHKENCDCLIREIIVDNYGREIIFGSQHAFQYSISIISITGKITTTNYRNGKEARKESYKYKRKK